MQRANSKDFKGSELLKSCMKWSLSSPISLYKTNLLNILGHHGGSAEELMSATRKQLNQVYELKVLTQIQEMVTLKLLPIPRKAQQVVPDPGQVQVHEPWAGQ